MTQFNDNATNARLGFLHHVEEERVTQTLSSKYGYPYINLFDTKINTETVKLLPQTEARQGELVLFGTEKQNISVAIHNPLNPAIPLILKKLGEQGFSPMVYLVSHGGLEYAWEHYNDVEKAIAQPHGIFSIDPELITQFFAEIKSTAQVSEQMLDLQKENSVTRTSKILSVMFGGALALKASDIHIEPEATATRIRFRLDGVLADVCDINSEAAAHITSRLKLLSGLKLNIHKEAQDGRFTFNIGSREVEVRSSIIPGAFGESLVMRLLDPSASSFSIEKLGLNAKLHDIIVGELQRPNGAIITTGPTGSGKTSALYSFLRAIHTPELKIVTLEDPIEYKLPGIVQTQITDNYSFAEGLRSILRQDPDVILIGEIRDREVAETAVHAALTGHLVFSTLHTNSAAGAFARLVDLGVDPQTIGSVCNIIIGQRLVRILCNECKAERNITTEEQTMLQRILKSPLAIHTIFDAKGCDACGHTGYRGRIGVFEAILMDDKLRNAVVESTFENAIREAAEYQGIPTMQQDGVLKVLAGMTSLDEVSRVLDLYHNE
ncbi:MAG: GspE/PulE family protein [Minisyncoccia bacterium]